MVLIGLRPKYSVVCNFRKVPCLITNHYLPWRWPSINTIYLISFGTPLISIYILFWIALQFIIHLVQRKTIRSHCHWKHRKLFTCRNDTTLSVLRFEINKEIVSSWIRRCLFLRCGLREIGDHSLRRWRERFGHTKYCEWGFKSRELHVCTCAYFKERSAFRRPNWQFTGRQQS